MELTSFKLNEEPSTAAAGKKAESAIQESSSGDSVTKSDIHVKQKFSFDDEDYLLAVEAGEMDAAQEMVDEAAKAAGHTIRAYHGTTQEFNVFNGGAFFTDDYFNADGYAEGERVIDAFLKIENPLFIDAKGAKWDELNTEYGETTREIVRRADNGNYDGVIFEDIADSWIDDEDGGTFTVYYPFKNDQIKYADTVTYNDNGNIIPLSERFNSENADMRYSIDEEFEADIDQWEEDGRPEGESFILGSTGDVLQGLGAIESDIYMQGDKIKTILREHPEMRLDEIKKILQVLDDPVLILKSRNVGRDNAQNTRLVIFGAVRAQNGKPVLNVLDLRPSEGRLIIDDMQKVNSAYVKDTDPVRFVRKSEVLYADKKRTSQLLRWVGFQMPTELLRHGSLGSITYEGDDVNISGEKFSEIVRERTEEARYSFEEDVEALDEEYRQVMDSEQPHRTAGDLKREIRDTIERGSRQEQVTEPTATVTRPVPAGEFYPEGTTVTHAYGRGKPV